MRVNFIVLCLLTLTLWIEFSFCIEPWLIHLLWIGIVHGILFDISGWYHRVWWILYTCKVIKGNACAYLGLLGVACSPFLSVSLEEVGCKPVLNLAATPDEAVSIICTVCWQNYTFNLLVRSWCIWAILLLAMVFSRASRRCFSLNFVCGFFNMVDLRFTGCVVKRHCSWRILILQCACQFLIGLGTSTHVCHNQFWLLYHQAAC